MSTCGRCGVEVAPHQRLCGPCGHAVADPGSATLVLETGTGDGLMDRVGRALAGEYEVAEELARGGMGVVFRAREVGLGRAVALKVLLPELAPNLKAAERFKREARMAADLDHPGIVPVYRVGQAGDLLYIAMKFVEGRSLARIIETQGPLPLPVVIHVLTAVGRGLAFAHERGIVHRDVKGDNILIDHAGHAMVTDFGVAFRAADVNLTVDGTVIGTPAYMSPEQCAGERAGPQSDQYSLGVLAFQMLTGVVPFSSETIVGYIQHHLGTPVPDIRPVRDDTPEKLLAVVNKALSKKAADRFDTMNHMVDEIAVIPVSVKGPGAREILRSLATGESVARVTTRPITSSLPPRPASAARRRRSWALAGAGVLVGASLVGPILKFGSPSARSMPEAPDQVAVAAPRVAAVPGSATPSPQASITKATAPAVAYGRLRLLTMPPDAEILVDGRTVGVGSVFDLPIPAGNRKVMTRATGFFSRDTSITVPSGGLVNLGRIALRARDASL